MSSTIKPCIEEEYSLCPAVLWRWRSGWRPLLIYFRGPGGIPFFMALLLTLVGVWRFARRPLRLADADLTSFRGATVSSTECGLGSYGMGGPGFAGLRLRLPNGRSTWIVFTLWGAAGWLTIDDDLLADGYSPNGRTELAGTRRFRPLSALVGATLTDMRLEQDCAELSFSSAQGPSVLRLRRDSSGLPVHGGSKQPKVLAPSEDVRDAVVISRRAALWV